LLYRRDSPFDFLSMIVYDRIIISNGYKK
jgi:hypothetical protein